MFKFFASLRRVLALQTSKVALGQVAVDFISRLYIPELKRLIAEETNPSEAEDLTQALSLWQDAVKPTGEAAWNSDAAKAIQSVVEFKWRQPSEVAEEIAQEIALEFYNVPVMAKMFDNFANIGKGDVKLKEGLLQGPKALARLWRALLSNRTMYRMRERMRHEQGMGKRVEKTVLPSGESVDIMETMEAPEPSLDANALRRVFNRLSKFVLKKFGGDKVGQETFKVWAREAIKNGADRVNVKRDIVPVVMESMGVQKSIINRKMDEIHKYIHEFFELGLAKPIGASDRDVIRKMIGSEGLVAFESYHRMFCAWMLGYRPSVGLR
jgi:hypothetical protein